MNDIFITETIFVFITEERTKENIFRNELDRNSIKLIFHCHIFIIEGFINITRIIIFKQSLSVTLINHKSCLLEKKLMMQ